MDKRNKRRIIFISILLHILLLLIWEAGLKLNLFIKPVLPENLALNQPIIFDLEKPDIPKQVIETPEDARSKNVPAKPKYLSDKNALARNDESMPNLKLGESFSKGDYDSKELIESKPVDKQLGDTEKENPNSEAEEKKKESPAEPESLVIDQKKKEVKDYSRFTLENLPRIKHDNRKTRVSDSGGLSFNTYDWDFAPYMIELKKRIQKNIYPPKAFTRYGMISGETILCFKIYPDGQLKDLKLLGYKGHISLMQTSNTAIEISVPFPRLPANFPEPFLEVTGKFVYIIKK